MDLEIFPVWAREGLRRSGVIRTPDCLRFERDSRVFDQLRKGSERQTIQTYPLPSDVSVEVYSKEGLVRMHCDRDGNELTYAYARDLKRLEVGGARNAGGRNVAIKAYIDALPDDLMVVLYWC